MFRTVNDQPTLWDAILPAELLVLPAELGRVDELLDDPVSFAPFATYFDARIGRPSIPMETYLRLMLLKFGYRLGYESLCREVADSISWQRFCRIPFGTRVPHPTTLMKLTTRCGQDAVAGLNEALLAKAATAKLLRTDKVRADTTVIAAAVAYPTDSGLLAKAIGSMARSVAAGPLIPFGPGSPPVGEASLGRVKVHSSYASCREGAGLIRRLPVRRPGTSCVNYLGAARWVQLSRVCQASSRIKASKAADHALGAGAAYPITKPSRSSSASGCRKKSSPSTPSRRHAS